MTDSACPDLLRLGRNANESINLALFEQGDCLRRGPGDEFHIARRSESDLSEKDADQLRKAAADKSCSDLLAPEVTDRSHAIVPKDFYAARMHASEHNHWIARVQPRDKTERVVQVDIGSARRQDALRPGEVWFCNVLNVGEPLSAQKIFCYEMRSHANGTRMGNANTRDLRLGLGRRAWRAPPEIRSRRCQRQRAHKLPSVPPPMLSIHGSPFSQRWGLGPFCDRKAARAAGVGQRPTSQECRGRDEEQERAPARRHSSVTPEDAAASNELSGLYRG
jgi:hypothetical protein